MGNAAALAAVAVASGFVAPVAADAVSTPAAPAIAAYRIGRAPRLPIGARVLGAVAPSTTLNLVIALRPRDPSGLARFAQAVNSPHSTSYRQFLKRGEFANRFGPTVTSLHAVTTALSRDGLRVRSVTADRMSLTVTGSARSIERTFAIPISAISLPGGGRSYTNTVAPRVSGVLAQDVSGIGGLEGFTRAVPEDLEVPAGPVRGSAVGSATSSTTAPTDCSGAASAISGYAGIGYTVHGAQQLASSYNLGPLYSAGLFGAGVSVAIYELEQDPTESADVSSFENCYGLSNSLTNVSVDGGPTTTSSLETQLDIETVMEIAPAASIVVYQGPNTTTGAYDTYAQIVANDAQKVISVSWGDCEPDLGFSTAAAENALFTEAAAQGQSVLAASGDDGADACDYYGNTQLATLDPASQPYVTAVGGTTLSSSSAFPPTEGGWSWSSRYRWGGGGGVSSNWAEPWYQSSASSSLGIPAIGRGVPDVSADADPFTGYLVRYSSNGNPAWWVVGGTSGAAPFWAGLIALADSSTACGSTGVGLANPALYALASTSLYHSLFNDITTGSNATGLDGQTGLYSAGSGYDMVTGLGTPNAGALIPLLCGPVIDGLSPNVASPGTVVTVHGANLGSVTSVSLGGVASIAPSSIAPNGASLTFTVPTGAARSTTVHVQASSSRATSPVTSQDLLTVGPPAITSVSPQTGSSGATVTITGSGFLNATSVDFGTVSATFSASSDTSITAVAPAGAPGTTDITVADIAGASATSAADRFTEVPSVSGLSATVGPTSGGTSVQITGSGFLNATSVTFGGVSAPFTTLSDNAISTTAPSHAAGATTVTVTNSGGSSATTPGGTFVYVAVPAITSISPGSASNTSGASVTITGSGFSTVSTVTFGSVSAPFTVLSDTTITTTVPAGINGTVAVVLSGPGGTSNGSTTFTGVTPSPPAQVVVPSTPIATPTPVAISTPASTSPAATTSSPATSTSPSTSTSPLSVTPSPDVSPTQVATAPLVVSGSSSTLSTSTPTVGGRARATITVRLRDAAGDAVAGRSVTLRARNGSSSIRAVNSVSNASGVATFTVTDAHPETVVYLAKDTTDGLEISSGAKVTFVPAIPVTISSSSIAVSSPTTSCRGSGPHAALVVSLVASDGSSTAGRAVSIAIDGSQSASVSPSMRLADSSGTASFTITDRSPDRLRVVVHDLTDGIAFPAQTVRFRTRC